MGKKINPKIFRISATKNWPSKWFALGKDYYKNTEQDVKVRKFLLRALREAGVDKVEIERSADKVNIGVHTAKPGFIIGRGGAGAEDLKKKIHKNFLKNYRPGNISFNIFEVDRPNLSSQIIIQSMILDLEKRMPFRKVMKQALSRVERAGALGIKIIVSGRLNGAEIAREEMLSWGKVPLQTIRADIDYARGFAQTTYGTIGVKVWIYKGEKFEKGAERKGEILGK